jgi:hypothetical protein
MGWSNPTGETLMPTDGATHSSGGDSPNEQTGARPDDQLVFAPHDLRDRGTTTSAGDADLGFALAPRPATAPLPSAAEAGTFVAVAPMPPVRPPTPSDSFVISQPPVATSRPAADALAAVPAFAITALPALAITALPAFAITAVPGAAVTVPVPVQPGDPGAEPLWLVREPSAGAPLPHGWSPHQGGVVDRTTHAAILRLREEAVHVSWQAAWLATTSGDLKHHRRTR